MNERFHPVKSTNAAMNPTVRERAIRGIGAVAILQVIGASLNFLTLIALARILGPKDFGIAAIAALVTSLISTFGDFGLGSAVIQRDTEIERALYTANTLRLVISITLFIIALVVAPFAATVFSAPEATNPIRVVAILFLLNGAMFMPLIRLSKELKFGIILRSAVASSIVSAIVSVTLAIGGFGYWAIIIASLVAAVINFGMLRFLAPWKIALVYDRRIARELVSYGKHLFLTTIFMFLVTNVDNAAVAYYLGPIALGYYALAFKWASVPTNFLSRVASQVMTPAYVLIRDSPDRLQKGYLETVQMITAVSLPVYVGLFIFAEEFVTYTLGPIWLPIVGPLRILSVLGVLRGLAEPGSYIFLATGRSKLVSISMGLNLVAIAVLVPVGIAYGGLSGIAMAVVIAYAAYSLLVQNLVKRVLAVTWRHLWRQLRGLVFGGFVMIAIVSPLRIFFAPSLLVFLSGAIVGLTAYLMVLRLLERDLIGRYVRQVLKAGRGA